MTYQVWLRDMTKCVELEAADVNLESEGEAVFWNFITPNPDAQSDVTVAAFPYDSVEYIVSVS